MNNKSITKGIVAIFIIAIYGVDGLHAYTKTHSCEKCSTNATGSCNLGTGSNSSCTGVTCQVYSVWTQYGIVYNCRPNQRKYRCQNRTEKDRVCITGTKDDECTESTEYSKCGDILWATCPVDPNAVACLGCVEQPNNNVPCASACYAP